MVPTLFEVCTPREDVEKGAVSETEFAADLARVIRGDAPDDYRLPARFFANTHPTWGLRDLLRSVLARLSGSEAEIGSVFRLHTNFGGGKTHGLIALVHAARGMEGVAEVREFVDPALVPRGKVRMAAFDGENADPANGRPLTDGVRAFTPWGEIAYALAGPEGFERVRRSDERQVAPGADTNPRAVRRRADADPDRRACPLLEEARRP
jgi:predicted AAA+ superfamily ATPase